MLTELISTGCPGYPISHAKSSEEQKKGHHVRRSPIFHAKSSKISKKGHFSTQKQVKSAKKVIFPRKSKWRAKKDHHARKKMKKKQKNDQKNENEEARKNEKKKNRKNEKNESGQPVSIIKHNTLNVDKLQSDVKFCALLSHHSLFVLMHVIIPPPQKKVWTKLLTPPQKNLNKTDTMLITSLKPVKLFLWLKSNIHVYEALWYNRRTWRHNVVVKSHLLCDGGYSCRGKALYPLIGYVSKVYYCIATIHRISCLLIMFWLFVWAICLKITQVVSISWASKLQTAQHNRAWSKHWAHILIKKQLWWSSPIFLRKLRRAALLASTENKPSLKKWNHTFIWIFFVFYI